MNLIRELGNCTEPPLELLRSLVRLSLHVQLGLRDSSDILSYKPLLRFARERNSEKEELVLRVILQLFLLALRRHKRIESIPDEFIQLTYSLMSEPFPEIYALLLYSVNSMTPVLQKQYSNSAHAASGIPLRTRLLERQRCSLLLAPLRDLLRRVQILIY